MLIYHKTDDYYGVLVQGHTVFSGSYEACVDYVILFSDGNTPREASELRPLVSPGRREAC